VKERKNLAECRWLAFQFRPSEDSAKLEQYLNDTLAVAAEAGKVILSKLVPGCEGKFYVVYLVCPQ